jgi:hypothetical protein
LTSLTMVHVTWENAGHGTTYDGFSKNPTPLDALRSLRVEAINYYGQSPSFAIHALTGDSEAYGGPVSFPRLERVALSGNDWERSTIKALLQEGFFPELKTLVIMKVLDAFDRTISSSIWISLG